jgi:hypothetical protein
VTWKTDDQSLNIAQMGYSGRRSQQSWGKWTFWGHVVTMDYVGSDLYVVLTDGNRMALEVLHTYPDYQDTSMGFEVYFDRKVAVTGVFNGTNTTWTVPYGFTGSAPVLQVLTGSQWGTEAGLWLAGTHLGAPINPGATQTMTAISATVSVPGNWSAFPCYVGIGYQFDWTPSRFYPRDQQGGAIQGALTTVNTLELHHSSEGMATQYNVVITPFLRDPETLEFDAQVMGETPQYTDGAIAFSDKSFRFDVLAPNDEVTLSVINDTPYPACFEAMTYEYGFIIPRGTRRM